MAFGRKKKEEVTWSGETRSQVSQRDVDERAGSLAGGCNHSKGTQTELRTGRAADGSEVAEVYCSNCSGTYLQIK